MRSPCRSSARSPRPVPPRVCITSNRTRDLHDALKRRCLYHWVEHPDFEREGAHRAAPGARRAARTRRRRSPLPSADPAQPAPVRGRLAWPRRSTGRRPCCTWLHRAGRAQPGKDSGHRAEVPGGSGQGARTRASRAGPAGGTTQCLTCPPGTSPNLSQVPAVRERIAVDFGRALRAAGVTVPPGKVLTFVEALSHVGLDRRSTVDWTGHATLLSLANIPSGLRPDLRRVLAEPAQPCLVRRWLSLLPWPWMTTPRTTGTRTTARATRSKCSRSGTAGPRCCCTATLPSSARRSGPKPSSSSPSSWSVTQLRRARRRCPAPRRGDYPDLRRTVRRALRSGGEPLRLAWRARTTRPRRLVLLVDVSGSMDSYARALTRLAHAAMRARNGLQVEVFTLGTRLTGSPARVRARPRLCPGRRGQLGQGLVRRHPALSPPPIQRPLGRPRHGSNTQLEPGRT